MLTKPNKLTLSIFLATCVAHGLISFSCGGGGTSVAPEPPAPPTTASLSATDLAFGTQPVALAGSPQAVTLSNTGKSTLKISSLGLTGDGAKSFVQTNTCGSSVAVGQKCRIAILFTPGAAGKLSASLKITDNTSSSPHTVALSGTGKHDVILTWSPSPTRGVLGYVVFRTTGARANALTLTATPVTGTTYVDASVQAGKKYQYWIRAVSPSAVPQSLDSPSASATIPTP